MARELQSFLAISTGEWIVMQAHLQQAQPRPSHLTLLDVIATVNDITHDEEQTAEVINYMLRSEHIAFSNETPHELRQLFS